MNWRRNFVASLVILTIIIFENVSSYLDVDRAKRIKARYDAGQPLYLTPLINKNQVKVARTEAQVRFPVMGTNRESYAGFLTVNEDTNSNLFFWFISAEVNPDRAPVIVYLEGGPGRTLFFNLFHQHGPFVLTRQGELKEKAGAMNSWYNVIYIDSPAGTGFSFMNEGTAYATNQIHIAAELLEALKQFFKMCAHFRRNDFYVAGESMAGKIVPALTSAIHWDNSKVSAAEKINLKGMIIGNGFMDPENQLAYGNYINAMGLIDGKTAWQIESLENQAQSLIGAKNHVQAYGVVSNLFALLRQRIGSCSASDIHRLSEFEGDDPYDFVPWLERSDVRKALHVGHRAFTLLSYETMQALKGDMTRSIANIFGQTLENYRALVYTGSFSIACPYSSVHQSLLKIEWSGKAQFAAAARKQWRVDEGGSKVLAGYVRNYGNLYEVLVRNTGHFPALEEPLRMVDLLNQFTQNRL